MVHKIQNTNTKQDLQRIKSFLKTNGAEITASICHLRIDDVKVATKLCKRKLFQIESKDVYFWSLPNLLTPASSELYKSDTEVMFCAYGQKIPTSKILVGSYSDQAGDFFAGEK